MYVLGLPVGAMTEVLYHKAIRYEMATAESGFKISKCSTEFRLAKYIVISINAVDMILTF
jgi:hypothetical protein